MKKLLICAVFLVLAACSRMPTHNTETVDDRPGLAFDMNKSAASQYEVTVDGVSYGAVSQYLDGENFLKLVDGTHRVKIIKGGTVYFDQKVYLGAGVNRVIRVGLND